MQKQQTTAGGETHSFDYTFDIPVEVAAAVCKYRHDRWKFEYRSLPGSMSQSGQKHRFGSRPFTSDEQTFSEFVGMSQTCHCT